MRRCLITGGAGFIGSHLTESLLASGNQVVVVDDESTGSTDHLVEVWNHPNFEYVKGSAANATLMRPLIERVEEVYHLAAVVGVKLVVEDPIHTVETNLHASELVIKEAARRHRQGHPMKLFLASSSEVYGKNPSSRLMEEDDIVLGPTCRPRWCYGAAKAIDEFLALGYWHQWGLPIVIGRFFNVVGPRQSADSGMVLPRFVDAALAHRKLTVYGDGQQVRCFAHVSEAVRILLDLMSNPEAMGQVFNIGNDEPVTILDLANRVIAAVDPTLSIELISYTQAYSKDFEDCHSRVPNLDRLRAFLDFEPTFMLDDLIRSVLEWRREKISKAPG